MSAVDGLPSKNPYRTGRPPEAPEGRGMLHSMWDGRGIFPAGRGEPSKHRTGTENFQVPSERRGTAAEFFPLPSELPGLRDRRRTIPRVASVPSAAGE